MGDSGLEFGRWTIARKSESLKINIRNIKWNEYERNRVSSVEKNVVHVNDREWETQRTSVLVIESYRKNQRQSICTWNIVGKYSADTLAIWL